MSLIRLHLLHLSQGLLTEALAALMTGVVTDTAPARPWAAAVAAAAAVTPPLRMMITTIAAALLVVTALAGTTTADALPHANSTIDAKEAMDDRRLVAAWRLMSMVHRVRATLMILTIPGPAPHPVVTMTLT
jgi:hypothetical protein